MKKHINLLKRQNKKDLLSFYQPKIIQGITAIGIITFIIFVFLIFRSTQLEIQYDALVSKKEKYLKLLILDKETEAKIRYFKGKQAQVNTFLLNDVRFVPYYQVLSSSLNQASNAAILDSVVIDKNRETQFVVQFQKYDEMLSFLKYVESEVFLKNFLSLSLMNFNLSTGQALDRNYQLTMKGVFRELAEKNEK